MHKCSGTDREIHVQHRQNLNLSPAWGLGFVMTENKVDNSTKLICNIRWEKDFSSRGGE